jgi:D-glycero-D-manno-heptose 1,7-bisphosphate phosphatase
VSNTKIVFLDRDGILNEEIGDYVYKLDDWRIPEGSIEACWKLKNAGYKLVVVTNQGGIGKGLYTAEAVKLIHQKFQEASNNVLDYLYYAPYTDVTSNSLMKKPGSLMLERGLAKYKAQPENCWLLGDAGRDIEAAHSIGVKAILVPTLKETHHPLAERVASSVLEAADFILEQS